MLSINGRKKGQTYERRIAKILGEALNIKVRRTPQSGGWSKEAVSGDIVPVNHWFALSVECKNYKTFPKQVYGWLVQAIYDAKQHKKVPAVFFHINKTTKKDVVKLNQTTTVINPFPNGEDFVIMRLSDFLKVVDKKKLKDESQWH